MKVLLFGVLRDRVGTDAIDLEGARTAGEVLAKAAQRFPELAGILGSCLVAVNRSFAADEDPVTEEDEIAILPPVSGGSGGRFRLTTEPLSIEAVAKMVEDPAAGAIVTFTGTVRKENRGRTVTEITYEGYASMVEGELAKIESEIRERWPDIVRLAVHCRTGKLAVGEASIVIAVSSPHRAEAFEAGRYAIDRVKETVPLWKKEVYEDGEAWLEAEGP